MTLKCYSPKEEQLGILNNIFDLKLVKEIGGMEELTFFVPVGSPESKLLQLEGYIIPDGEQRFVIRELNTHGKDIEVYCMLDIEELYGHCWGEISKEDVNLVVAFEHVLQGTGWQFINRSIVPARIRSIYIQNQTVWEALKVLCEVFFVEMKIDTHNKTITVYDLIGEDNGVFFISDTNLINYRKDMSTHKLITRLIPIGKDNLTIESVNGGKNYIDNNTYSDKLLQGLWIQTAYTDPKQLKEDAIRWLEEYSKPLITYNIDIIDLYRLNGNALFKFNLGDVVTILDKFTEEKVVQRVVKMEIYPHDATRNTIELSNKGKSFSDYFQMVQLMQNMANHFVQTNGGATGTGSTNSSTIIGSDSIGSGHIKADSITTEHLQANIITSDKIIAGSIKTDHLMAGCVTTDKLVANSITTDKLSANSITADKIGASEITAKHLQAGVIDATHIKADSISTEHLKANIINAEHIQSGSITAGSSIIADGAIGNAQISNIDANKINAGEIDTSKVKVKGENGFLFIENNTLFVVDNNRNIRCELGVIENNSNYGFIVRGADGETILIDHNGVHNAGITDGAIDNRKVSENANISGKKLDIDSVIRTINEDGSITIEGTKIQVGNTTLDVELSKQTNLINSHTTQLSNQQSSIKANTDAIKLKVDSQTYIADKNNMTTQMNKNTSAIDILEKEIALKVEQSDIKTAIDEVTGELESQINEVKSTLEVTTEGILQEISQVESTVNNEISKTNSKLSSIETNVSSITSKVSNIETTTNTLEGIVTSYDSRISNAESKVTASAITNTVKNAQFIKDLEGNVTEVSNAISQVEQKADSINNTVKDLSGRYTEMNQTLDGITTTVNGKVDASEVTSIIQQNPTSVQIGFNGINDRISINERSMDFTSTNGNRDMLLYGGQVCIYNNMNNTFMSTIGSVLKTADKSYKGVGFLLGKNANIFTIGRDATWDDILSNRNPNPLHYITFNFDTKQADIDMELNTNRINMRNHTLRNASAVGTQKLQTNTWYDLADNPLFTLNKVWGHVDMYQDLEANYHAILNARFVNPQVSYNIVSGHNVDVNHDTNILIANEDVSKIDEQGNVSYDLNEMIKLLYKKINSLENEIESLKNNRRD